MRLVEYALNDMEKTMGKVDGEKGVDLVIGIAGFDFYKNDKAPTLDKLHYFRKAARFCRADGRKKAAYFKCMVRDIFKKRGWKVGKVILTGDHSLLVAGATEWLESKKKSGSDFDFIQATTIAVPYKIREGKIEGDSARLPKEFRLKGGFWDLGAQARKKWFSPLASTHEAIEKALACSPVNQALYASSFANEYDQVNGDNAMFRRWQDTGTNTLGLQLARISDDRRSENYTDGVHAVPPSVYKVAKENATLLVNEVIRQMGAIINHQQDQYYGLCEARNSPIITMGGFAADALASPQAKDQLMGTLTHSDQQRINIIPGDDFFYTLSGAGKKLLEENTCNTVSDTNRVVMQTGKLSG